MFESLDPHSSPAQRAAVLSRTSIRMCGGRLPIISFHRAADTVSGKPMHAMLLSDGVAIEYLISMIEYV